MKMVNPGNSQINGEIVCLYHSSVYHVDSLHMLIEVTMVEVSWPTKNGTSIDTREVDTWSNWEIDLGQDGAII